MPRMFKKTPRKSTRGTSSSGARGKARSNLEQPTDRLNGHFQDGKWNCNCEPRHAALLLQVKKNNGNKGRWFYTCSKDRRKQCDFFMWKEDGEARENGSVLDNSEAKVNYAIGTPSSTLRQTLLSDDYGLGENPVRRRLFPPSNSNGPPQSHGEPGTSIGAHPGIPSTPSTAVKRKRVAFADPETDRDGDGSTTERDEFEGGFDSEEEQQLIEITNSVQRSDQKGSFEGGLWSSFLTPTPRRSHDVVEGIPTPTSYNRAERGSGQPQAKRHKPNPTTEQPSPSTPELTPPSSFASAKSEKSVPSVPSTPTTPGQGGQRQDLTEITEEILSLIPGGTAATEAVRQQISSRLSLYGLQMAGIERGRDIAREKLIRKVAEVQTLQARLVELENESRKDKDAISRLKKAVAALAAGE